MEDDLVSHPPPVPPLEAPDAYDLYAPRYDDLLHENRINRYMRRTTTRTLLSSFPPGVRLLEMGCGTGDEALDLAAYGCEVVACDPSQRMIEIARRKAKNHRHGDRVQFRHLPVRNAEELLQSWPERSFQGAYSSFALSYEEDLEAVRSGLSRLMEPHGLLVVSVMNRVCAAEVLIGGLTGRPSLWGRRLRRGTLHKVGSAHTLVYPRNPREVAGAFTPGFVMEEFVALPFLVPPHYANRPLRFWPSLLRLLERVDGRVSYLPFARSLGDHTLIKMRRQA